MSMLLSLLCSTNSWICSTIFMICWRRLEATDWTFQQQVQTGTLAVFLGSNYLRRKTWLWCPGATRGLGCSFFGHSSIDCKSYMVLSFFGVNAICHMMPTCHVVVTSVPFENGKVACTLGHDNWFITKGLSCWRTSLHQHVDPTWTLQRLVCIGVSFGPLASLSSSTSKGSIFELLMQAPRKGFLMEQLS